MCIVNQVNDFYMTVHCAYQSFAYITNKRNRKEKIKRSPEC